MPAVPFERRELPARHAAPRSGSAAPSRSRSRWNADYL
jgi:hypothetical protein